MAVYDYVCPKCGLVSEINKPMAEYDRVEWCQRCDHPMKRKFSANPFVLKGGGWYKDGYSKSKPPKPKPGKVTK